MYHIMYIIAIAEYYIIYHIYSFIIFVYKKIPFDFLCYSCLYHCDQVVLW